MKPYPLALHGLEDQRIALQPAGVFRRPTILVDDVPAPSRDGHAFIVRRPDGTWTEVLLRPRLCDPVPVVDYEGERLELAPRLRWHECTWLALPLLLSAGGVLGAAVGLAATYLNTRLFRLGRSPIERYGLTAIVGLLALGVALVLNSVFSRFAGVAGTS